jgi:hypothetical protein
MVRSSPAGGEDVDVDGGWVAAAADGAFSALFGDGAFYAAWADMGPAWRQRLARTAQPILPTRLMVVPAMTQRRE